ncbi:MAG TPA: type II toxin-antitoxin system PemK/MazF family toxin, partial [Bradyrhizobium sp.]|nr:type II toxin-antitoxin system PemK/MazF family toxin [Bradyrhizobium sp.]
IDASDDQRLYFHEGDIWWIHLGVNVGYEIDGKQREFSRPVVVLRKYNQYSFLALPLTTNDKPSKWRVAIGEVAGRQAFAVLSQLRNIDKHVCVQSTWTRNFCLPRVACDRARRICGCALVDVPDCGNPDVDGAGGVTAQARNRD